MAGCHESRGKYIVTGGEINMRRMALLLVLWFCFSVWLTVAVPTSESTADSLEMENVAVFVLPASLTEIGESAFEGTAVEKVIFPDTAAFIGDKAFANNKRLMTVRIPETVRSIGEHAFSNSTNVTIKGTEGSYAAVWAREHNIAFESERGTLSWLVKLGKILHDGVLFFAGLGFVDLGEQKWQRTRKKKYMRSMRPQDRVELNPIEYRFP